MANEGHEEGFVQSNIVDDLVEALLLQLLSFLAGPYLLLRLSSTAFVVALALAFGCAVIVVCKLSSKILSIDWKGSRGRGYNWRSLVIKSSM